MDSLPSLLTDGALSLGGQSGEHDDNAVVAWRALHKVLELVPVELDDGALERELSQLIHLVGQPTATSLLLPAQQTSLPDLWYRYLMLINAIRCRDR